MSELKEQMDRLSDSVIATVSIGFGIRSMSILVSLIEAFTENKHSDRAAD